MSRYENPYEPPQVPTPNKQEQSKYPFVLDSILLLLSAFGVIIAVPICVGIVEYCKYLLGK